MGTIPRASCSRLLKGFAVYGRCAARRWLTGGAAAGRADPLGGRIVACDTGLGKLVLARVTAAGVAGGRRRVLDAGGAACSLGLRGWLPRSSMMRRTSFILPGRCPGGLYLMLPS